MDSRSRHAALLKVSSMTTRTLRNALLAGFREMLAHSCSGVDRLTDVDGPTPRRVGTIEHVDDGPVPETLVAGHPTRGRARREVQPLDLKGRHTLCCAS